MLFPALLWVVFLSAFVVQMLFWGVVFKRFASYLKNQRQEPPNGLQRPVSVIICARNEADNLKNNLPSILNQDYPDFEVLVVNDGSTDSTAALLNEFSANHGHLTVLHIGDKPSGITGKKYALERGILCAKNDWLLLTDADCVPASDQWIAIMDRCLPEGKDIGLGYGPYSKRAGLLNRLIRFETVYTAIQFFSFTLWGMPYMGVGRNLFYHKRLFEQAGGFSSHAHIASGDDDLFVNAVATESNTAVIIDHNSFVYSKPEGTFPDYLHQKSRHYSTSKYYGIRIKSLLFLLSLSQFLFFGGFFTLLVFEFRFTTVLFLVIATRYIFLHLAYEVILQGLKEKDLLRWIPVLDFLHLLFILLLAPTLLLTNMRKWK